MSHSAFDVVVIGSGSAGRAVAGRLADAGVSVAMVERELVGGECPYWACMPAKALLRAPEIVGQARRVPGVATGIDDVDAVLDFRDGVAAGRDDARKVARYEGRGVVVLRGHGRLLGPGRVAVDDRELRAARIVVATGSTTVVPPIEGIGDVGAWSNREAMAARPLPGSAVMLGGGAVGVEVGQAFARLGCRVTIVESEERLLAQEEPEVGDLVGACFAAEGIDLRLGVAATRVERHREGVRMVLGDGGEAIAERLVLATGRRPVVEGLGLESVGIVPGEDGIAVDERCRAAEGVWAIGDVTGIGRFTHVASYQGRIACADILGQEVAADYSAVPRSVFCDPEVAAVGLTVAGAREAGIDAAVASVDLDELERATTLGRGVVGRIGVVADRRERVLAGAHGVGPAAAEWMSAAVLAIRARVPADVIEDLILQFPTLAEGLVMAVRRLEW